MSVTPFACGRAYPWRTDVTCIRQRAHAGEHRGAHDGRVVGWSDSPYTVELDEATEDWSSGYVRDPLHPLEAVALVLVIVVLATGYPLAVWLLLVDR